MICVILYWSFLLVFYCFSWVHVDITFEVSVTRAAFYLVLWVRTTTYLFYAVVHKLPFSFTCKRRSISIIAMICFMSGYLNSFQFSFLSLPKIIVALFLAVCSRASSQQNKKLKRSLSCKILFTGSFKFQITMILQVYLHELENGSHYQWNKYERHRK